MIQLSTKKTFFILVSNIYSSNDCTLSLRNERIHLRKKSIFKDDKQDCANF